MQPQFKIRARFPEKNGGGSFLARHLRRTKQIVRRMARRNPSRMRPTGGPGRDGVRDVASRSACQRSARRSVATPRHAHASPSGREKTKSGGVDELSRCVSNRHRCRGTAIPPARKEQQLLIASLGDETEERGRGAMEPKRLQYTALLQRRKTVASAIPPAIP